MTDFDQTGAIASRLQRIVADSLQAERDRRRRDGLPLLTGEDELQQARSAIGKAVQAHAAAQLAAGAPVSVAEEELLRRTVFARMFAAGRLQPLLDDNEIENIDINGHDQVFVTRAGAKHPERVAPVADSDAELIEQIRVLATTSGLHSRPWDEANPEVAFQLPDGSRLVGVLSVAPWPSVSIRRHRYRTTSLDELRSLGTMSTEVAAFLKAAVRAKCNIVICGETDSGKTTLLRALASEIGPHERVITVEALPELDLHLNHEAHPNVVPFEARPANTEGRGEINVARLVEVTRRLNPDRVIVGEVQGGEVIAMLQAMTQGNDGSMSSVHTYDATSAFDRLATYALMSQGVSYEVAMRLIGGALHFVVFVAKDRDGQRRVEEIVEINGFDPEIGVLSSPIFELDEMAGEAVYNGNEITRAKRLRERGGWSREGVTAGRWTP